MLCIQELLGLQFEVILHMDNESKRSFACNILEDIWRRREIQKFVPYRGRKGNIMFLLHILYFYRLEKKNTKKQKKKQLEIGNIAYRSLLATWEIQSVTVWS